MPLAVLLPAACRCVSFVSQDGYRACVDIYSRGRGKKLILPDESMQTTESINPVFFLALSSRGQDLGSNAPMNS